VAFGASEAGAIDASVGAGLAVASSVGVGVTVDRCWVVQSRERGLRPEVEARTHDSHEHHNGHAGCHDPAGRGSGITPRRNGSSTKNQLAVATGMERTARATA